MSGYEFYFSTHKLSEKFHLSIKIINYKFDQIINAHYGVQKRIEMLISLSTRELALN